MACPTLQNCAEIHPPSTHIGNHLPTFWPIIVWQYTNEISGHNNTKMPKSITARGRNVCWFHIVVLRINLTNDGASSCDNITESEAMWICDRSTICDNILLICQKVLLGDAMPVSSATIYLGIPKISATISAD